MSAAARVFLGLVYAWRHRRLPRLHRPHRFTEWVQWRKLNDRDLERARLTDKLHGKQLAEAALGADCVIPTLWQGVDLPADAPWPMPFIVKSNHGCGHNIVVRCVADYARARRSSRRWLGRSYGGWLGEWHYRAARRRLLVEPLVGTEGRLPIDYKVYVFGGRASNVQVHEGRAARHRWSQYGRDWQPLSARCIGARRPETLADMLVAAERLGAGHDFVRVDFYEVEGRLLFGEYCLFPGSGLDRFDPPELDSRLGALWGAQYSDSPQLVAGGSGEWDWASAAD